MNVSDPRQVAVSMSTARFSLYSVYDTCLDRIANDDDGYARYMLPMLQELQTAVRKIDGDQAIPFDYAGAIARMLAKCDV